MPARIKEKYIPRDEKERLAYLTEECGEVLKHIGKIGRFGAGGSNPDLPEEERIINRDALLLECVDLERAIKYIRIQYGPTPRLCCSCEEGYIVRYEDQTKAGQGIVSISSNGRICCNHIPTEEIPKVVDGSIL
jgi:hypothetical protein